METQGIPQQNKNVWESGEAVEQCGVCSIGVMGVYMRKPASPTGKQG